VVVGPFGRFLEFAIGRVNMLLRFCRVTAEPFLIFSLRFVDLSIGLLEVMLRLGKIRMPVAVNVDDRTLAKSVSRQNEAAREQAAQYEILDFHSFLPPNKLAANFG
jgi:hypothetical protein